MTDLLKMLEEAANDDKHYMSVQGRFSNKALLKKASARIAELEGEIDANDEWTNGFIEKTEARIAALEAALREAYEVYAGSDGFIPETAAEGYQQQIIKQMVDIIGAALEGKDD